MSRIAIIGSGMGGLVAGNLLAKKGHAVTIFESHTGPGGYTGGFRRKGFYFESGTMSFELSSLVFGVMKEIGVFDRIPFSRQHGRWIFEGLDGVVRSYGDFKKVLFDAFPGEKDNLLGYFARLDRMHETLLVMYRPRTFWNAFFLPFRLARVLGLFARYDKMTVPEFTARHFETDSPAYRILKDMGYPDMGASILGGAAFTFFDDYWTVTSGMQSWADVLAENFRNLGGDLRLGSKVDVILTRNGTATGVAGGGEGIAADYVIAAGDFKKTFLELLDDKSLIPSGLREKIGKAPVSEGFFTVYLGLDIPTETLRSRLIIPHIYYSEGRPDLDVHDSNDSRYFEKAWIVLYSPSLMDPSLAPEGASSLMIQAMAPPHWLGNWGGGEREAYRKLKSQVKNTLIDKASVLVPGLRKHVVFEDAATPLTYERYTHNTDGASSAWSWNPKKRFYKSILSSNVRTPVKNLLIGSCWATQLGGVPGAITAALNCVKIIGS